MKHNAKLVFVKLAFAVAIVFGGIMLAPWIIFDKTKAGYDTDWERTEDGKGVAWGPRPRGWLILADPNRSSFSGQEWYYRWYADYCNEW